MNVRRLHLQPVPNVFLRADITFSVGDHTIHFDDRNVSSYGIFGLPWPPLTPSKHFGNRVELQLRFLSIKQLRIHTMATIVREITSTGEFMGLRLEMDTDSQQELKRLIQEHGYCPPEFIRKFPRIPSNDWIQSFPMQITATPVSGSKALPSVFILEVRNVSLGGVMATSENPFGLQIQPKDVFDIVFEPRGPFKERIGARSRILRILEEPDLKTGNVRRHFGFRFQEMAEGDRSLYLDRIKQILNKVRVVGREPQEL